MPKGVPVAGFRKTKRYMERAANGYVETGYKPNPYASSNNIVQFSSPTLESDEQIATRLNERFSIMESLVECCVDGSARALIISGPPGLGKSFTVEKTLEKWDRKGVNHTIVKGYVRATGLIRKLYQYREAGQVVVFDDSDSVFFDDNSLNIIKAVCDTTEHREVSWLSEGKLYDEDSAVSIPRTFTFNGSVIFLTNYDFDDMISRGHKLAPHFQALMSRAHYVNLTLKSKRDYLVRIFQVVQSGMLDELSRAESEDVLDFIVSNSDKLRELSLRMAVKIANIRKSSKNWRRIAMITCCK